MDKPVLSHYELDIYGEMQTGRMLHFGQLRFPPNTSAGTARRRAAAVAETLRYNTVKLSFRLTAVYETHDAIPIKEQKGRGGV